MKATLKLSRLRKWFSVDQVINPTQMKNNCILMHINVSQRVLMVINTLERRVC